MYSLLFLGVVSSSISFLLTPLVRNLFRRFNLFDPPSDRKVHTHPVPRVGGIAIVLSYVLSFALLLLIKLKAGLIIWSALPSALRLLPAAALIFAVGLLDDLVGLKPWRSAAVCAPWR